MIKITFPDNSVREFPEGITGLEIAKSLSNSLAEKVLSIGVNGETWDLTRPINKDANIKLFTWDDDQGKLAFWHSSAHLMAEALEFYYPGVKLGIGPSIENGFYYDIDTGGRAISEADFPKIEQKMVELSRQKNPYIRREVPKAEAVSHYREKDDEYKIELLEDLEDGTISFYHQGNFTDLCRGPHLPDTGYIKSLKLLNIAGAYWRGDERNKQLTRIYGISFPKQKMLEEHLVMLEEAKARDHRKIGRELEIFAFSQKVGAGLPLVVTQRCSTERKAGSLP
jgi:threonyl-tRNA synthetase